MTRDDIIRMAREAGFMVVSEGEPETGAWYECFTEEIERFAALVAARALEGSYDEMIALVRAAEREACAKVLDEMADDMVREMEPSTAVAYVRSKAAVIRAKGDKPCK